MTNLAGIFFLLGLFGVGLIPRDSPIRTKFVLIGVILGMSVLSVSVGQDIAQDRGQYFSWYRSSDTANGWSDVLFGWFLFVLPGGLSEASFSLVLMLVGLVTVIIALSRVAAAMEVHHSKIALVLLALVLDRIFIDLMLNTVRSTISFSIILIAITGKHAFFRIFLSLVALGIHSAGASAALLLYAVIIILAKITTRFHIIFVVCLIIFIVQILGFEAMPFGTSAALVDGFGLGERVTRSILQSGTGAVSSSLIVQIFLAIILPFFLYISNGLSIFWGCRRDSLMWRLAALACFSGGVILLFYPLYPLVLRFAIFPMIVFLIAMPSNLLLPVAFLKLILYFIFIA